MGCVSSYVTYVLMSTGVVDVLKFFCIFVDYEIFGIYISDGCAVGL